jgi:hypothetical protein
MEGKEGHDKVVVYRATKMHERKTIFFSSQRGEKLA